MANLVGGKKVYLDLTGINGNAFSLMGHFRRQAAREGWTDTEIQKVLDEARSGDYNHLIVVLLDHIH